MRLLLCWGCYNDLLLLERTELGLEHRLLDRCLVELLMLLEWRLLGLRDWRLLWLLVKALLLLLLLLYELLERLLLLWCCILG